MESGERYCCQIDLIELKLIWSNDQSENIILDLQIKCDDIFDEILNAAVDTEQTFRYGWPITE